MTVYAASQRAKKDTINVPSPRQRSSGTGNNHGYIKNVSFEDDDGNKQELHMEGERAPLLTPQHYGRASSPPPPPPPPRPPASSSSSPQKSHDRNHGRTRSVGASGAFFGTAFPSPKDEKRHSRTKSLEEWADMFGISGITDPEYSSARKEGRSTHGGAGNGQPHGRPSPDQASGYRRGNNYGSSPIASNGNGSGRKMRQDYHNRKQHFLQRTAKNRDWKPPLPPKSRYESPNSVKSMRKMQLDSIVESDHNESDESPDNHHYNKNDDGAAASAASAVSYHESASAVIPDYSDVASLGSNASSSIFSIPKHLTNSGQYSSSAADDDNSVGSSSTTSGWTDGSSAYHNYVTTERLAKFEMEQEQMFQQKKYHMERELSNVLERNAVKSHREKQEFINVYLTELEKERERLVAQWKAEWEKEEEFLRERDPKRKLMRDVYKIIGKTLDCLMYFFSSAEVFISNMPLTIAALALSWVSMGCCWFKFMEENVSSCNHVHFYSPQCTFPEFPGCFECDLDNDWYRLGLNWHYFCSIVSFIFCFLIMLKAIIAWDVVVDELGNPTTSTPLGVFCVAMVCVFAGRGPVGEIVVLITATCHLMLAFWFLYMALVRYHLYPDPGWFPNTVGISYAAVKSFLYFPMFGELLMGSCLTFFVGVFFVSLIRVATNEKISAPICWFMLSAPSITLYAVTLILQPTVKDEEIMNDNPELKAHFLDFLHHYYMPLQHFLFASSIIGVISAVHGVWFRWDKFKLKQFSPAHVAFCAPTLAHTNAIQSYLASLHALSTMFPAGSWYCNVVYCYWCFMLFAGTTVNFVFTYKFLRRLPEWTRVDITGEELPPAPYETMTHDMLDHRGAHETFMSQPFVSPAVLQANEAGALVRVRRGTEDYRIHGPFVRTRKVTARGFDPSMNDSELREERAALLDWVAKNAPRKRNRTMSVPDVMHLRDKAGRGVYGSVSNDDEDDDDNNGGDTGTSVVRPNPAKHARSKTSIDGFW